MRSANHINAFGVSKSKAPVTLAQIDSIQNNQHGAFLLAVFSIGVPLRKAMQIRQWMRNDCMEWMRNESLLSKDCGVDSGNGCARETPIRY